MDIIGCQSVQLVLNSFSTTHRSGGNDRFGPEERPWSALRQRHRLDGDVPTDRQAPRHQQPLQQEQERQRHCRNRFRHGVG